MPKRLLQKRTAPQLAPPINGSAHENEAWRQVVVALANRPLQVSVQDSGATAQALERLADALLERPVEIRMTQDEALAPALAQLAAALHAQKQDPELVLLLQDLVTNAQKVNAAELAALRNVVARLTGLSEQPINVNVQVPTQPVTVEVQFPTTTTETFEIVKDAQGRTQEIIKTTERA